MGQLLSGDFPKPFLIVSKKQCADQYTFHFPCSCFFHDVRICLYPNGMEAARGGLDTAAFGADDSAPCDYPAELSGVLQVEAGGYHLCICLMPFFLICIVPQNTALVVVFWLFGGTTFLLGVAGRIAAFAQTKD